MRSTSVPQIQMGPAAFGAAPETMLKYIASTHDWHCRLAVGPQTREARVRFHRSTGRQHQLEMTIPMHMC